MSQHGIGGTYHEPIPQKVADYNVSGSITPNATCNYYLTGTYNENPYYARADQQFFIWYRNISQRYTITRVLGVTGTESWLNPILNTVIGTYAPLGYADGNAIVAAGPH